MICAVSTSVETGCHYELESNLKIFRLEILEETGDLVVKSNMRLCTKA